MTRSDMANSVPKREEIAPEYKWNLEDIYDGTAAWESDFAALAPLCDEVCAYKGRLLESAEVLKAALDKRFRMEYVCEKLYTYAAMHRDEDNANTIYQALCDRAMAAITAAESRCAFWEPELIAAEDAVLEAFFEENAGLGIYRQYMTELRHQKQYILSEKEERILALAGEVTPAPEAIYSMLTDADMRFGSIEGEDGEETELTQGRYIPFMQSRSRDVRKAAFTRLYKTYGDYRNTIASAYSYSVKQDVFYARSRGYKSSLEKSLYADDVPVEVYTSLIEAVHDAAPDMYRYMQLKKQLLGLDELHMYDVYVPLTRDVSMPVTYEEACALVLEALSPLGEEYTRAVKKGLEEERWVDVHENQGKTSGAYSWGVWGVHPYVLLNWSDTMGEAFTLAHELGHAMHSLMSNAAQPYVSAGYPLLLAEVASTCNEVLFMQHMLKKVTDRGERMYLLNYFLEQFRTTLFRQVMFAEFEMITHQRAEAGEPLTAELLCEIYADLNRLYYGPDVVTDEEIAMEWARIPHFYRAFYVYKYATGFASAIALARMVLQGEEGRDRYLKFLQGGGSRFPLEQLKNAGVDLRNPDCIRDALKTFAETVDELAAMI